jgi:hypothetical protein
MISNVSAFLRDTSYIESEEGSLLPNDFIMESTSSCWCIISSAGVAMGISSISWVQLSRFQMKTGIEASLQNVVWNRNAL